MGRDWLMAMMFMWLLVTGVVSENRTLPAYPLLTPPDYNVRSILRVFVELQNQWCPPRRYKKMFILNYNNDQFSEEILTAILKRNEPPKILSNEPTGVTYWTYEIRRCAVLMMKGDEKLKPTTPIFYGSRYLIFHPKLQRNTFMEDVSSGQSIMMDKAYHIVYNRTGIVIYHKNFFANQTITLDPGDVRVPDDLQDLHGRKLRMWVSDGSHKVASFDVYLGETIARMRNGTFELMEQLSADTDYGVMHVGLPLLGSDQILALGSTFVTALVPRSKAKPVILILIDPFDFYTWIGLFAMVSVMALVLARFGQFLGKLHPFEVGLELVMCILSGPSHRYGGWLENQLITNFCLLSIVLVSSYQSLIISYLSVVRYFPEINSVDDIRSRCVFPTYTVFARLLDLQVSAFENDQLCFLFNSRDNRRITSLMLAHTRDTDSVAHSAFQRNLRIADATFYNFHMLYYFYHKSLVRELFPFFISAFYESGLFDQYYKNKTIPSLEYRQDQFVNRAFSVADLSIVWCLFLAGTVASIGCFLLEAVLRYFPARMLRDGFNKFGGRYRKRTILFRKKQIIQQ